MQTQQHSVELVEDILTCTSDTFLAYRKQATEVTEGIFSNRRSLFNPIYLSDVCVNDCSYCGYRSSNTRLKRRTLTPHEAIQEVRYLVGRGVNHILLLAGEFSRERYFKMLTDTIVEIEKSSPPEWLGLEVAPLHESHYEVISELGVDCVTVFQETYDDIRYGDIHRGAGPKGDFSFRLGALERAATAGVPELGFGVLCGLGNYYNDVAAMIRHAAEISVRFPEIKLRFSFPRLKPSEQQSLDIVPNELAVGKLLRAIVSARLCFPEASLVVTGRESTSFLLDVAEIVNILGKDGSTAVGGYSVYSDESDLLSQFELDRDSSFRQFKQRLEDMGYELS